VAATERAFIIDIDDGPFGGGGAALLRCLRCRGTPFRAISFDPLSSGYHDTLPGDDVVLVDAESMPERPFDFGSGERVFATSTRAIDWLERKAGGARRALPEPLRRQIEVPRHLDLLRSRSSDLLFAAFEIVEPGAPDDGRFAGFETGFILSADGRVRRVQGPLALWYELRRSHRGGDSPVAVIPSSGLRAYLFAVVVDARHLTASAVLAADALHESWRPALARSVDGRLWHRFAEDLAAFIAAEGIFHGIALAKVDGSAPRLLSMRPGVPSWIEIAGRDGGGLVDAMLGKKSAAPRHVPADRTFSSVPIDAPIRPEDIIARLKSS
jgi:hypothetical protein